MSSGEVFTALGYVVGALVFWLAARERKLATDGIGKLAIIGAVGGIIGAKLSQIIMQGAPISSVLNPQLGGRALLGGVLTGWLCVEIAKRRMGIRRSTGDLFALALPAGEAVGRIGCFFNGCCYGAICDLPWAVHQHGAIRHPAQLYSAIVASLIFVVLLSIRKRVSHEGDLFRIYLILFGVTRFGLEFVRERESLIAGLSPMQWFCLELAATGAIAMWWSRRPKRIAREESA